MPPTDSMSCPLAASAVLACLCPCCIVATAYLPRPPVTWLQLSKSKLPACGPATPKPPAQPLARPLAITQRTPSKCKRAATSLLAGSSALPAAQ